MIMKKKMKKMKITKYQLIPIIYLLIIRTMINSFLEMKNKFMINKNLMKIIPKMKLKNLKNSRYWIFGIKQSLARIFSIIK